VSDIRKLEAERQELMHMPDLFRERILDMDEEIETLLVSGRVTVLRVVFDVCAVCYACQMC